MGKSKKEQCRDGLEMKVQYEPTQFLKYVYVHIYLCMCVYICMYGYVCVYTRIYVHCKGQKAKTLETMCSLRAQILVSKYYSSTKRNQGS